MTLQPESGCKSNKNFIIIAILLKNFVFLSQQNYDKTLVKPEFFLFNFYLSGFQYCAILLIDVELAVARVLKRSRAGRLYASFNEALSDSLRKWDQQFDSVKVE